jgi:hypothetical protein
MYFESIRTTDQRLIDLRTKYPKMRPKLRHWFHGDRMKEDLVLDRWTMIGFDGPVRCIDGACTQLEVVYDKASVMYRDGVTAMEVDQVPYIYTQHYRRVGDELYRNVLGPFGYTVFKKMH